MNLISYKKSVFNIVYPYPVDIIPQESAAAFNKALPFANFDLEDEENERKEIINQFF